MLSAHLVRTASAKIIAAGAQLVACALAAEKAKTTAEALEADLAFSRVVVEAAGQSAVTAIMHTTARLVREVAPLAEALYGDRAYHRRVVKQAAQAFGKNDVTELEDVLAAWDRRTVTRFRTALEGRK